MSSFEIEINFQLDSEIMTYKIKWQSHVLSLAELVGLYFFLYLVSEILLHSYVKASFLKSVLEDAFRVDDYTPVK